MPLRSGSSQSVISDNIREMRAAGHPEAQAVAAALHNADRHPSPHRTNGGIVRRLSGGPLQPPVTQMPAASMAPGVQGLLKQYASLPTEKLQELGSRLGGSPYGQIIQRVLQARQMGQIPNPQPQASPQVPGGPMTPGTPMSQPGFGTPSTGAYSRGGGITHLASGGNPMGVSLSMASPWWTRSMERESDSSFLHGYTPGRGDHLLAQAPVPSYVLPADVVAGLGEGNSLAGARVWDEMMRSLPYGETVEPPRSRGLPLARAPRPRMAAARGAAIGRSQKHHHTPVALSDGEVVVGPRDLARIGHGNIKAGWKILDRFVKEQRAKHIAQLKKLPGPVGSKS